MLSHESIQHLYDDGYIQLPGAVALSLVETALHAIYHGLGSGIPQEELAKWQSQSFFPELATQEPVTDLFNASGLRETCETLLGEDTVPPIGRGQLALRFPAAPGTQPGSPRPHIDGIYTPLNGVTKGTLASFTALIGVFLTDVTRENAGNLMLWPGSHRAMEQYFKEHGPQAIMEDGKMPPLDYGTPRQVLAHAGDAVIAHWQLGHSVASNIWHLPRFAVFFRINHPAHKEHRTECLTDLWREWPGVRAGVS